MDKNMIDKIILEKVELLDRTASQVADTSDRKDEIIRQLKVQVGSLKTFILSTKENHAKRPSENYEDKGVTQATSAHQEKEKPKEDYLKRWKVCTCDHSDCSTCTAEREASIAATEWFDGSTDIQKFIHTNTEASPTTIIIRDAFKQNGGKEAHSCSRCAKYQFYDKMQEVTSEVDTTYFTEGHTTKFVIRLHPSLSVTSFPNRMGSPFACSVVCVMFAEKMIRSNPISIMNLRGIDEYLSDEVYEIVSSSLRDGIDTYAANYGDRGEHINARDLVLMLSDLGISLKEDTWENNIWMGTVMAYIKHLQLGEMMLLTRMDDYNVWSFSLRTCSNDVVILDCQSHNVFNPSSSRENVKCGAVIYHVCKQPGPVFKTLKLIEQYSGPFKGPCQITIIQV